MATHTVWTVDRITALGVTTDLATAASILGIGRSAAYELAAHGRFPAPIIRAGSRIIVPVAGLRNVLLIDTTTVGGRLDPVAGSSVHGTTPPADSTRGIPGPRPDPQGAPS